MSIAPNVSAGETIGRFRIVRPLGFGSTGTVYEAVDTAARRMIALKVLRRPDPKGIARFKAEFRSVASLAAHKNLIRLHELFAAGPHWCIVMEYLEKAQDLLSWLRDQPCDGMTAWTSEISPAELDRQLPPVEDLDAWHPERLLPWEPLPMRLLDAPRVRSAMLQLAHAVGYLHRYHRLHRDIKPSNVLVTPDGRVVLADVGLVAELTVQAPEGVVGTVAYMAPEQAAGLPLTPAADWYAVGVLLFEALTGVRPFQGPDRAVLHWKREVPAPSPADVRLGLPEDLVRLCMSLLQRDPESRPVALEVIGQLRADGALGAGRRLTAAMRLPPQPPRFVGRASHLAEMQEALAEVRSQRAAVCTIRGASGSGKSALLQRFAHQIQGEGVLVLRGRCFEHEAIPCKAFDGIIEGLVHYLATLPLAVQAGCLPTSVEALGTMFPAFARLPTVRERLGGSAPSEGPELRSAAARDFAAVVGQVARSRALVLAIDDLQWHDPESLDLLRALFAPIPAPPLLLLLAYRTDPAPTRSSLQELIAELRGRDIVVREVMSGQLGPDESEAMALALLETRVPEREALAQRIANETQGVPLFIVELCRLANEPSGQGTIPSLTALLWERIQRYELLTRTLLEVLAVAARPIRLRVLRHAVHPTPVTPQALQPLLEDHLIDCDGFDDESVVFTTHDSIRERIVEELSAARRVAVHSSVGAALLQNPDNASPGDLALHFMACGEADLASTAHLAAGDLAADVLAFAEAEHAYHQAWSLAHAERRRVQAAEALIHYYTRHARFGEAVAVARRALAEIGQPLPMRVSRTEVGWRALWLRLRRSTMGISTHPMRHSRSTDRDRHVLMLLNAVAKAAYQVEPLLCVFIAMRSVALSLGHGLIPEAAIGYTIYGTFFLGGIRRAYDASDRFAHLALTIAHRSRDRRLQAEVNFLVGYLGTLWSHPLRRAELLLVQAYDDGVASGDVFHTGCAAAGLGLLLYQRGTSFEQLYLRTRGMMQTLRRARLFEPLAVLQALHQLGLNLRRLTKSTDSFSDAVYDENAERVAVRAFGSRHFAHCYWLVKMQSLYLWGHLDQALAAMEESTRLLADAQGLPQEAEHHFLCAMILLAHARSSPSDTRRRAHAVGFARHAHALLCRWADRAPRLFQVRERLLAVELAQALEGPTAALRVCHQAVAAAQQARHPGLLGIALLLRAQLVGTQRAPVSGLEDRMRAARCFRTWGAVGLADQLRDLRWQPALLAPPARPAGEELLQRLVRIPLALEPALSANVRPILEAACHLLQVARATLLLCDGPYVVCVGIVDRRTPELAPNLIVPAEDIRDYRAALASHRILAISDTDHDPRCRELVGYLRQAQLRAILDAPIYREGQLAGLLCFAHAQQPRVWTEADRYIAAALADFTQLALTLHGQHQTETVGPIPPWPYANEEAAMALSLRLAPIIHQVNRSPGRPELLAAITACERELPPPHEPAPSSAPRHPRAQAVEIVAACRDATACIHRLYGDQAVVFEAAETEALIDCDGVLATTAIVLALVALGAAEPHHAGLKLRIAFGELNNQVLALIECRSPLADAEGLPQELVLVHELLRVCGGGVATVSFQGSSVVSLKWPLLVPGVITDNP